MQKIVYLLVAISFLPSLVFSKSKEKEAPSWVTEVATRPLPTYPGRVPAAVLLNEQKVTFDSSGVVTTVTRRAIKVLTHDGKREAEAVEGYEKGGLEVKDLHAWLVAPGGYVRTFDKSSVEDLGAYSDELYNSFRMRRIKADNPEIGSVFVYESQVQQQAMTAQDLFAFSNRLPCLEARYSVTAPTGWTISGRVLNHEAVQPVVEGNTFTWTLKALPFREREELAPFSGGTAPLLALNIQPAASVIGLPSFKAWPDVSAWHTGIAAPQAEISPEMEAKVRTLTAGLSSEYEKVRAVSQFVQKIRYVEIAMDLSHNGGVRPHPAAQVFAKQYGDCKDKANLMRALLKSAGIPSYLVAVYSGDRTYVKPEWASPWQFNHMILAVGITAATKTPTAIDSPVGRVLLFDPTDDKTPLGDLPFYEQGSYGLLCAGVHGDLLRMPVLEPEANLLSQTAEALLDAQGNMQASLSFESTGQIASRERHSYGNGSPEQYKSTQEKLLGYYAKGATITKLDANDAFEQNRFCTRLSFSSDRYGQLMQGRMLVFTPAVLEPSGIRLPAVLERLEPVILNGRLYRKHIVINLPAGFTVDEMPSDFTANAPFANFKLTYRQEPGRLVMDEELRTEATTIPAADYAKAKKFFDDVFGADNQNAVLVKN